jgi:hypothetical protein
MRLSHATDVDRQPQEEGVNNRLINARVNEQKCIIEGGEKLLETFKHLTTANLLSLSTCL